jgi:predicted unusual protein kinase regulating ubiquinone biosynthesis (AarF/ABC1/UbiB family)
MKKMTSIKNSALSRGIFAVKSAVKLLPHSLNLSDQSPEKILTSLIGQNAAGFVDELGALKGSIHKAAQLLTSYAEYYLPKETNEVLRKVLNQSQYLDWKKLEPTLPSEILKKIEISQQPLAAASIGQVHRGKIRISGEEVVLKVQYPGVRKAIDIDILILKQMVSLLKIIPRKLDLSDIYLEIKKVLSAEMDYILEASMQDRYAKLELDIPNVYVPKVYHEYSNSTVIVSEYIAGISVASIDASNMSQEKRDLLGEKIISLYFYEIFHGGIVQTDCHAGNFLVREKGPELELVLIDFGACIEFSDELLNVYRDLIRSLYFKDKKKFIQLLHQVLGDSELGEGVDDDIWEYLLIATEPLHFATYDWGNTNLPDRLFEKAKKFIANTQIEKPPHKFIFLDRKLVGVFSILRQIKARVEMKTIADKYIC